MHVTDCKASQSLLDLLCKFIHSRYAEHASLLKKTKAVDGRRKHMDVGASRMSDRVLEISAVACGRCSAVVDSGSLSRSGPYHTQQNLSLGGLLWTDF